MTQPFVPGYGPSIPAPTPGVDVQDEGVPIPGPTQTLNFVGAGVSAAPGAPGTVDVTIPGGGGAVTGFPNALLFENPAGLAPTTDAALVAAPVDVFGRPQIWDYRLNAGNGTVWRQGQWVADGDPGNVIGEGFVSYGPAGGVQDAANGMFARVKYDRFGLRRIIGGVDIGYSFRVDTTEMYLKNDLNVQTFNVNRTTGDVVTQGGVTAASVRIGGGAGPQVLSGTGSPEGVVVADLGWIYLDDAATFNNAVWAKINGAGFDWGWVQLSQMTAPTTPGQDEYAAYSGGGDLAYASGLRFPAPSQPRFFELNKGFAFDNSVGYAVVTFDPPVAPPGAPYFGAGNGLLWKAQDAAPGSGTSGGDSGVQAGNSPDAGAIGGTAFLQPGRNPASPADDGIAEMRNAAGAARVSTGGATGGLGFQGASPIATPTVVGSRGGNAALASLLTQLANYGLIIDGTVP